jgi:hypothetical protein
VMGFRFRSANDWDSIFQAIGDKPDQATVLRM